VVHNVGPVVFLTNKNKDMVLVRLFLINKTEIRYKSCGSWYWSGCSRQKEQRLGTRVVVHGTGQAVLDQ
jgi:hypothetical protein